MEKTKIVTLSVIATVLIIAVTGVAYAQYKNAQGLAANSYQGPAKEYNGNYGYPSAAFGKKA